MAELGILGGGGGGGDSHPRKGARGRLWRRMGR